MPMAEFMSTTIKSDIVPLHSLNRYSLSSYSSFDSPSSPNDSRSKSGEHGTQHRHLNQQIDHLNTVNAQLNNDCATLKLDNDKRNKETVELKQALRKLVEQNIRLQRSNRLLKDEFDTLEEELKSMKEEPLRSTTDLGPEYKYLVQTVNALYKQLLSSESKRPNTCCLTGKSIPRDEKHVCRPIVKSHIASKSIDSLPETDRFIASHTADNWALEKEKMERIIQDKDNDNKSLRHELTVKDGVVKQLEKDFHQLELEINDLQKNLCYNHSSAESSLSDLPSFPSVPN
ncbi:hypothetical protein BY458DRAFT_526812 [Sporodiniella umbellata]|nr:hypothetical protein BY458DRAFT_526812 [Sporodiniella umbellata]